MFSQRALELKESSTLKASDRAKQLKAQGKDIISLTLGEPDFSTPSPIVDYAKAALDQGKGHHYTPAGGLLVVREAIAKFHQEKDGVPYTADQVFIANGSKLVLYDLFQILLNPGDEVIVPSPYWVSYEEQIRLTGAKAVLAQTDPDNDFRLTPKIIDQYLTSKTKILLINSPANPTGTVLSKEELVAIADYCLKNNLLMIVDEIYSQLVYNGNQFYSMAALNPEVRANTIVVNGMSKSYAMTGWRLGYCLADQKIIKMLNKLAGQISGNAAGVSQYAALGAFKSGPELVESMRSTYEERLNKGYEAVINLPGFELANKPQGAFYLFPKCQQAALKCGYDSVDDFVMAILEEAHVALVAGSAFGMPEHVRLSYATDENLFLEAIERISSFMQEKMN
ncbi:MULTISPECIES: pyridoxal phosphate-dependent aminotransferase [Aerococcus]|uniref:pyridoxal phosphate-dependent aminotransferase n=1 Tax=Aerococcus TaxID=1375 RepID=UPI000DCDB478|nr:MULTISPECIES: pyridoxal phosphate-dependent aminotransferase [Aerococcus]KAA9220219.1 pyridoxal phosphate-dependent aminotransferase [Aerococcus loyolae]KAA9266257.1 pyridoxal phosphate-dependent aminotransferase [Aerococcus loyolae]MDK6231958.1 pyridoxal phosphate-dependent aminotransferase [Aerococcus urinae]MDK6257816.1 pyridoxal phosphate-dependent aminotransferase [Aerococcus urinae]MDK6293696.1 pyridoxal phosphate-dependent aminotransferase [Aerococcus urinae]